MRNLELFWKREKETFIHKIIFIWLNLIKSKRDGQDWILDVKNGSVLDKLILLCRCNFRFDHGRKIHTLCVPCKGRWNTQRVALWEREREWERGRGRGRVRKRVEVYAGRRTREEKVKRDQLLDRWGLSSARPRTGVQSAKLLWQKATRLLRHLAPRRLVRTRCTGCPAAIARKFFIFSWRIRY